MNQNKLNLTQALVVEGKYDAARLSHLTDAMILLTDGFGIYKDKKRQQLLKALAKKNGLILFTDSDAADGDPAVLTDMVWKEVVVEIPNLKPEDTITIMGKTNEAKAGKGRFFIDDVSIVKK